MNEKLIVAMAGRLGISADVLDKSDDEVQSVISDLESVTVLKNGELEKLRGNVRETVIAELSDPKNQLPQPIYKRVQGTVLETTESRLKKKFGFEGNHDGIDDLVDKISGQRATQNDSDIARQNENLKKTVKEVEAEMEKLRTESEEKVKRYIITDQKLKAVSQLPLKVPDEALAEAQQVYLNHFDANFTVDIKNDIPIVTDKTGKVLQDKLGDPISLVEALKLAKPKIIEFKDLSGGRGDDTKAPTSGMPKNTAEFVKLCEEKGIKPNSPQGSALLKDIMSKNPNFNK